MIKNITHRNGTKASDNVKARIDSWLDSAQERFGSITRSQVIIDKNDRTDCVEAVIHVAGKDIFAKAEANNMYAALDAVEVKINRQLEKFRQKQAPKRDTFETVASGAA
ncbi:MAG: ribosome hibernation-promoting factor, HPF/YfiA family [Pontibacterium sp.]